MEKILLRLPDGTRAKLTKRAAERTVKSGERVTVSQYLRDLIDVDLMYPTEAETRKDNADQPNYRD